MKRIFFLFLLLLTVSLIFAEEQYIEVENGIYKWVTMDSYYEYDFNGKLVHAKLSDGQEIWNYYDSKGNLIKGVPLDGSRSEFKYDANGNKIYSNNESGEMWFILDYYPDKKTIKKEIRYKKN